MQTTLIRGNGTHVRVRLTRPDTSKVTVFVDGKVKEVPITKETEITFAA